MPKSDDDLESLRKDLQAVTERSRQHRRVYKGVSYRPSLATREEAQALEGGFLDQLRTTYGLAAALIIASEDNLDASGMLLSKPLRPFAMAAVCRSCFETTARVRWLLDARISARDRSARGVTEHLYSRWETARLEAGRPFQDTRALEKVVHAAREGGFNIREHRRFKGLLYAESPRPSATSLIDNMFHEIDEGFGKFLWQLYSAISHGVFYGLVQMFEHERELSNPTSVALRLHERLENVMSPAALALLGFMDAFGRAVTVHGWDTSYWREFREGIYPRIAQHIASG